MSGRTTTFIAAFALASSIAGAGMALDNGSPTLSATPARQAPSSAVPAQMPSDRVLGRADAPVTIIEYASFTCSHCATFSTQVLPELKKRYIDTGKARLIFRDLPTAPVQVSNVAAAIGRCAAPGKFFDVADHFMGQQAEAFASGKVQEWILEGVNATGRSREQIEECVRLPATADGLTRDTESAVQAGVNSTPALFVNGRRLQEHTLDAMVAAIEPLVR